MPVFRCRGPDGRRAILMRATLFTVFGFTLVLSGCVTLSKDAEEFGTTNLAVTFFHCDGETWVSNEADEKVCVMRSRYKPNRFLIRQDQFEGLLDEYFVKFAPSALLSPLLPIAPLLFSQLTPVLTPTEVITVALQFLDDDTPNRWYRAADHYVRKHYGAKATMVRFKPHKKWGGYTFEVKPASQVPSWVKLPPKVLARKIPQTPKSESEKRAYTLHNPQHKATKISRISGVSKIPDGDSPRRWYGTARQHMRKDYGVKAKMVGYTLEGEPDNQVRPRVNVPPGVLARKMPDTFKSEPAKRIYTLHSMVSKAVYSSRIPGRVEPRVRTEELDSPIPVPGESVSQARADWLSIDGIETVALQQDRFTAK